MGSMRLIHRTWLSRGGDRHRDYRELDEDCVPGSTPAPHLLCHVQNAKAANLAVCLGRTVSVEGP